MARIDFFTTANGQLSARFGDHTLYSRYDPEKEADRFVAQSIGADRGSIQHPLAPAVVVILGAGLGYIEKAVTKRLPDVRIISLYLHDELYHETRDAAHQSAWFPSWRPAETRLN
ncbi:MAG TPA: hypothetical protein ENN69_06865, partial [Spirochaetia bacterium]|nr:hypothetical protein [Spirochaetia bacterium]